MSLLDEYSKSVPDYYPTMYMDGYTPDQIYYAAHRKMIGEYQERKAAQRAEAAAKEIPKLKIISEVKIR